MIDADNHAKAVVTFEQLVALEPGLADLLAEARRHRRHPKPDFCANAVFYGYAGFRPGLKERLQRLVGFERRGGEPLLRTPLAYDVAYETIYEALPDCRGNCACSGYLAT